MKKFTNKTFSVTINGTTEELSFAKLSEFAISAMPKGGFSLDDYARRIKLVEKLQDSTDEIILEDAEHDLLSSCMAEFRPTVLDSNILTWKEAVDNATTYIA